jgi:hypothetical protein
MEIANTNTEFTFIQGYVVPEKVFQYVRRNQYVLQTKELAFIQCEHIVPELPYLFRNKFFLNSFQAQH